MSHSPVHDQVCLFVFIFSNFSDVFDEDHFISALAKDIKVIKKLPKELASATKVVRHFRSWSGMDYYEEEIATLWEEYQVFLLHLDLVNANSHYCCSLINVQFCRLFELQNLIHG